MLDSIPLMRTTVELPDEQRAKLLQLAAERGEKGFSALVQLAIARFLEDHSGREQRIEAAVSVLGTLREDSARSLEASVKRSRKGWR